MSTRRNEGKRRRSGRKKKKSEGQNWKEQGESKVLHSLVPRLSHRAMSQATCRVTFHSVPSPGSAGYLAGCLRLPAVSHS